MKSNIFLLFFIFLSTIVCGQEIKNYQMPDQQIFNAEEFALMEEDIRNRKGIVVLYDSIVKNDTIIYKVGIKPDYSKQRNPYVRFQNQIGEEFPLDLFGIEKTNQPMFINFWFTSCVPCIREIPDLNYLADKYKDQARFIAITFNTQIQVEKFLDKRPIHFEHLTDQKKFLDEFGVRSYPMNVLIDKNAKILYVEGMLSYSLWEVENLLDKELSKK